MNNSHNVMNTPVSGISYSQAVTQGMGIPSKKSGKKTQEKIKKMNVLKESGDNQEKITLVSSHDVTYRPNSGISYAEAVTQDIPMPSKKINERNIFDDDGHNQGRIRFVHPPVNSNISLQEKSSHRHVIFGSYCLEDISAISSLVLNSGNNSSKSVHYDCFNYESVSQLQETLKKYFTIFTENKEELDGLQEQGKLSYTLHYEEQGNNLLEKLSRNQKSSWKIFACKSARNIFFFNPYLKNKKGTSQLISALFAYARTYARDDGIVTIMWNPARRDSLKDINVEDLATKKGFVLYKTLSGKKFADLTDFAHLKNDRSLEKTQETNGNPKISSKDTDILLMFKRVSMDVKVNRVAAVLINQCS